MPNKDGYQACKEIRRWEKKHGYRRHPIIALSANVLVDPLDPSKPPELMKLKKSSS
jgi:CheY-like chemotaxis protein